MPPRPSALDRLVATTRGRSMLTHASGPHAASLSPSTCRNHPSSWFQLAKVWLTSFLRICYKSCPLAVHHRRLHWPVEATDPVLEPVGLFCRALGAVMVDDTRPNKKVIAICVYCPNPP